MPKTTNLNLEIGPVSTELFSEFRTKLNGNNDGVTVDKSNMQLIDDWAGGVNELLDGLADLLAAI